MADNLMRNWKSVPVWREMPIISGNAFCPTGEGGGQDNSCSPGGAGSSDSPESKRSALAKKYDERRERVSEGKEDDNGGSSPSLSDLQNPSTEVHKFYKEKIVEAHKTASCKLGASAGKCDQVSTVVWDKLGKPKNLRPYTVMFAEDEHVLLHDSKSGLVIDPTGSQFEQRIFTSKEKTPYKNWRRLSDAEIDDARKLVGNLSRRRLG